MLLKIKMNKAVFTLNWFMYGYNKALYMYGHNYAVTKALIKDPHLLDFTSKMFKDLENHNNEN